VRRRWKERSENTHWLDASYYPNVGAIIKGIKPLKSNAAGPAPAAKPRSAFPTSLWFLRSCPAESVAWQHRGEVSIVRLIELVRGDGIGAEELPRVVAGQGVRYRAETYRIAWGKVESVYGQRTGGSSVEISNAT
jgi:hypothetical protein